MKKTKEYCQVKVEKINDDVHSVDMSWIPAHLAKKGKYLRFKRPDGTWDDGWKILEVWGRRPALEVESYANDYKKQRSMSDI